MFCIRSQVPWYWMPWIEGWSSIHQLTTMWEPWGHWVLKSQLVKPSSLRLGIPNIDSMLSKNILLAPTPSLMKLNWCRCCYGNCYRNYGSCKYVIITMATVDVSMATVLCWQRRLQMVLYIQMELCSGTLKHWLEERNDTLSHQAAGIKPFSGCL